MTTRKQYHLTIDSERCKGCDLCMAFCAKDVIAMGTAMNSRGQHYARPTAPELCIGCLQCADICPDAAIEIEEEQS
ncbi:MAG: 4Fe-4S dicluster domain-containing protein [bacterium]